MPNEHERTRTRTKTINFEFIEVRNAANRVRTRNGRPSHPSSNSVSRVRARYESQRLFISDAAEVITIPHFHEIKLAARATTHSAS